MQKNTLTRKEEMFPFTYIYIVKIITMKKKSNIFSAFDSFVLRYINLQYIVNFIVIPNP